MNTIAEDTTIALAGGFRLEINITDYGVTFTASEGLEPRGRRILHAEVKPPLAARQSWHRPWDPAVDEPEYSMVEVNVYGRVRMQSNAAQAFSELLGLASEHARAWNEQHAETLAHQEQERRVYREQAQREKEEEEQKRKEMMEELQWYIGQKFKLRRKGYKATVFGVIDRVTETTIYTTSERGVPMTTTLLDLQELHIMYEGEKRYTKVYPS